MWHRLVCARGQEVSQDHGRSTQEDGPKVIEHRRYVVEIEVLLAVNGARRCF